MDRPARTVRDASRWRGPGFELDEPTLELRVGGQLVALEPKPLELLMLLLRHAGEVVTKDELFDALWTGRVVVDSVLTSCVGKLRQALGDDGHRLVRTVHGYGYRLVAEVRREWPAVPAAPDDGRLHPGEAPPLRPDWQLVQRFGGSRAETWLARHPASGEQRVLKFAFDGVELARLKREITLHRLLRETLGPRDDILGLVDWNLARAPWFVESAYCPEGDLLQWCAAQGGVGRVAPETRLDLVARTADALAAAHGVGVLHKDVKPANVLAVRRAGGGLGICLADFGSGRLIDADRLRALQITQAGFTATLQADEGSTVGTWVYLAPELLGGQPPTVRSDVYALGVMLFQLVVGDLRRPLAPGWEREVDDPLLREDIGACCDLDPQRRLADASELARRLRGLAARREAAQAQAAAQAREAALQAELRRSRARWRRLGVLAAVAGLGFAVTLYAFVQVRQAREAAEAQAAAARGVNDFLVRDLLAAADPMDERRPAPPGGAAAPGQVPVRELLDRAAAGIATRYQGQPALEAAVRFALGGAYAGITAFREAAEQYQLAVEADRRAPRPDALLQARALLHAGRALREAEVLDTAGQHYAEAVAILDRFESASPAAVGEAERLRAEIGQARAWLPVRRGDAPATVALLRAARPSLEAAFGARSAEVATSLSRLANAQLLAGDVAGALATAREALAMREQLGPADDPRLVEAETTLADALRFSGEAADAERHARQAYELGRRRLGENHYATLVAEGTLAGSLQQLQRYDEALRLFEGARARSERLYGREAIETLTQANNLGIAYADAGRPAEAAAVLREVYELRRDRFGPDYLETLIAAHNLGDVLIDVGRAAEAEALERDTLARMRRVLGERRWEVGVSLRTLGRAQAAQGRLDEARASYAQARELLVAELGAAHPQVAKLDRLITMLDAPTRAE